MRVRGLRSLDSVRVVPTLDDGRPRVAGWNTMSGTWDERFKGCAFGCGALVVGTVLLAIAGTLSVMRPFRHALDDPGTAHR